MGRPRKKDPLAETQRYIAQHWDVLSDLMLCGMSVESIAVKRHMGVLAVRQIIRGAWALEISAGKVRKYMERG